jgi:hypothetical protein
MGSRRHLLVATFALVAASAACASGGASTANAGGEEGTTTSRQRANRNVLTAEDLRASPHATMLDVVTAMRPHWLRATGTTSFGNSNARSGVTVYVDGQALGSADALRTLETRSVARATFRTTAEAQNRYGMRVTTPVIDIETLKGRP